MSTEAIVDFLWRHFGSHERPAVVHALLCRDWVVAPDGTELDFDLDDEGVSLEALVAEVWTWRNEKMGNLHSDEWVYLFDACQIPVMDSSGVMLELPFTAYRAGHPDGMSWTTDRAVADHFALRNGVVHQCTVTERIDILAVLGDRGEHEVVLHPRGGWRRTVSHACHAEPPNA